MPRVTVVMAVYNVEPYLEQAVASVLHQTYTDFELIAVEDCSTDNSRAILEGIRDPRLRIVQQETNQGASEARNAALAIAAGDLVAVMDADDLCAPNRLERQVEFLDQNPGIDLVGCAIYDNIDEKGKVLGSSFLPVDSDAIQHTLMNRWCFLHSSIMVRRTALLAAGGYRKEFEPAEDHDVILRILDRGKAHNLPERLVSYRLNPRGLSVAGHRYIDELGNLAIRVSERRRRGEPEQIDAELPAILAIKQTQATLRGIHGQVWRWRDRFYAAGRYYGFGCQGLCLGELAQARRAFTRSISTSIFFWKSWAGLSLTWMPALAKRSRFLFHRSIEKLADRSSFQSEAKAGR